jgi:hypothetical protein
VSDPKDSGESAEPALEAGAVPEAEVGAPGTRELRERESQPPALESGPVPEAHVDEAGTASRDRKSQPPALEGGPVPEVEVPEPGASDAGPTEPKKRRADPQAVGCLMACSTLVMGLLIGGLATSLFFGEPEQPPESVDVLRDSPNVVVAIQDLARLETTSYHVERVIDLVARQRQLFGLVEAEDAILLVAAGDVVAGVDLTRMSDGDVVIEPERNAATVTLPPVEIFSARLDNERTYVHTRETDLTASRDPHLETRARREAERTLREAALEAGILDRARANAETAVGTLVKSLGYDEVTIRWQTEPASEQ